MRGKQFGLLLLAVFIAGIIGSALPAYAPGTNNQFTEWGTESARINVTGTWYRNDIEFLTSAGVATFVTVNTGQGANELFDMDQNVLVASDVNFSSVEADDFFLKAVNKTDIFAYPQETASYTIWVDGANYYAKNGTTGQIDYSGTDFSTVIQSSIDSINISQGGKIVIGSGIFYVSAPINITDHLWIAGLGIDTTYLRLENNADCNMFQYGETSTKLWVTIEQMTLYGNKDNNAAGNGIFLKDAPGGLSDTRIRDLYILEFAEDGIHSDYTWNYKFENIVSEYNDGYGMHLTTGSDEVTIIGCHMTSNELSGLLLSSVRRVTILGGEYARNKQRGIIISGGLDNAIVGVSFAENDILDTNSFADINEYGTRTKIVSCNFYGNEISKWNVNIGSVSVDLVLSSNAFSGANGANKAVNIHGSATNPMIRNNQGFITENSGNATLAAVTGSIVVNHGLEYTPTLGEIQVTPNRNLGNCTYYWYDTITATQFTIHVGASGAEKNIDQTVYFLWSANRN